MRGEPSRTRPTSSRRRRRLGAGLRPRRRARSRRPKSAGGPGAGFEIAGKNIFTTFGSCAPQPLESAPFGREAPLYSRRWIIHETLPPGDLARFRSPTWPGNLFSSQRGNRTILLRKNATLGCDSMRIFLVGCPRVVCGAQAGNSPGRMDPTAPGGCWVRGRLR